MSQTTRYIRRLTLNVSLNKALAGPGEIKKPMFQFSVAGLVLFFYAIIGLGFLFITSPDAGVVNFCTKYLVITAASAGALPILAGKNWYKLGPVFREYQWGTLIRKKTLPKYGMWIIGIFGGFGSVALINFAVTRGFLPTLDFWPNATPQILFSNGAIVEEFYFRIFPYKALERIAPWAFTNLPFYLTVVAPADSALFTVYHLAVYGSNNLALSIVFFGGYSQNLNWRGLKLDWVIMAVHVIINITAPAQLIVPVRS